MPSLMMKRKQHRGTTMDAVVHQTLVSRANCVNTPVRGWNIYLPQDAFAQMIKETGQTRTIISLYGVSMHKLNLDEVPI